MEDITLHSYQGITYEKRKLTNQILLKVIADDYKQVKYKSEIFEENANVIKRAEMVSQHDACPVEVNRELEHIMKVLRKHYETIRARNTQTAPVLFEEDPVEVSDEDIQFLLANGSIAVLAEYYENETKEKLLEHEILPLVTAETLRKNDYVFIENIAEAIEKKQSKLKAFLVKDDLEPIDVWLPRNLKDTEKYETIWKQA